MKQRATCHPDVPHAAFGLCTKCYYSNRMAPAKRRYNFDPGELETWAIPVRVGYSQRAVTQFPLDACPKCGKTNTLMYEGREARCAGVRTGCGTTVWLVREEPAAI